MTVNSSAQSGFLYDTASVEALELAISAERLHPYIIRAGGSRVKAILLYERNVALSEALYGVTQGIEIALRNVLHSRLSSSPYGPMWFDAAPLESPQAAMVIEAKAKLSRDGRGLTPGALVAELSFGFWTALLAKSYEKLLWVPHLHKAFPHAVNKSRFDIHEQLAEIRLLRNRIAHYEPILKLDLPKYYARTLKALEWICPVSAKWIRATNCFPHRLHEKPLKYDPPKLPPQPLPPMPGRPVPQK